MPCKEPIAGGTTGVMVDFRTYFRTLGDLHKFEVNSHDESLRRRITKLNLKVSKEQLDFV